MKTDCQMGRELHMPQIDTFDGIFEAWTMDGNAPGMEVSWEFNDYIHPRNPKARIKAVKNAIPVGGWCAVSRKAATVGIYARPRPEVMETVKRLMIPAGVNDRITFQINIYDDGTALALAKNSVIIGSLWLAMIKAESIPAEIRARVKLAVPSAPCAHCPPLWNER